MLFCPLGGFSQEELLKIWKGLFYCMWVQDEPLLQVTYSSLCRMAGVFWPRWRKGLARFCWVRVPCTETRCDVTAQGSAARLSSIQRATLGPGSEVTFLNNQECAYNGDSVFLCHSFIAHPMEVLHDCIFSSFVLSVTAGGQSWHSSGLRACEDWVATLRGVGIFVDQPRTCL